MTEAMSDGCVFIDGAYVAPGQARMSIFDMGFVWGDTVYDVTSTWNGWFFMLDEHLERFAAPAKAPAGESARHGRDAPHPRRVRGADRARQLLREGAAHARA